MEALLEWTRQVRDQICPPTAGYSESAFSREAFVFLGPDENADDAGHWQRHFLDALGDAAKSHYSQVTLVCGQPDDSRAVSECVLKSQARTLAMEALQGGEADAAGQGYSERRRRCPSIILLDGFWFPPADAAEYAGEFLASECPALFVFAATTTEVDVFVETLQLLLDGTSFDFRKSPEDGLPGAIFAKRRLLERRSPQKSQTASRAASPSEESGTFEGRSFADVVAKAQEDKETSNLARGALFVSDSSHRMPLRRPPELPIAQDRKQFAFLWGGAETAARLVVENTLGDKLKSGRDDHMAPQRNTRPSASTYWREEIAKLLTERVDDEHIYSALRRRMSARDGDSDHDFDRAGNRVQQIQKVLPLRFSITSMLDIGCAEGAITAALGTALHLSEENIHGVDIRDVGNAEGFNFHLYDGERLPFENESIDFVVALMTLHHVREPHRVLAEAYRICSKNGYLIIREHDCSTANGDGVTVALDVVHGLYALSMTDPPEWPNFATEYYAFYRDQEEWHAAATRVGWKPCVTTRTRGKMHYFYALFRKVGSRMDEPSTGWGRKKAPTNNWRGNFP